MKRHKLPTRPWKLKKKNPNRALQDNFITGRGKLRNGKQDIVKLFHTTAGIG